MSSHMTADIGIHRYRLESQLALALDCQKASCKSGHRDADSTGTTNANDVNSTREEQDSE